MYRGAYELVSDKKLLGYSNKYFLYYAKGRFCFKGNKDSEMQVLPDIPLSGKARIFRGLRLAERLFRLEPRCAIALNEDTFLVSYCGGIYRISVPESNIVLEHTYRAGMNNALNLCKVEDIHGFDDCVVYGEYFGNAAKEEVNIFARYKDATWKKVFTFPKGKITHIHNVIAHPERDSILVFTGDGDTETLICELKNNFQEQQIWAEGNQKYRACVAFPKGDGVVYATDTPLEENAIYYLEPTMNGEIIHQKIQDISGPCIYGTNLNGQFVFATSVEPDPRLNRWCYLLTYKLGVGVKDRNSHIYVGDYNAGFREVFRAKKDGLPMLLFQFGNFQFPTGIQKELYVTGQSLKKLDGKTVKITYESGVSISNDTV